MIHSILKRGGMGACIGLISIVSMIFAISLFTGDGTIVLETRELNKYLIAFVTSGFVISASSVIFETKKIPKYISLLIHFMLTISVFNIINIYLHFMKNIYLVQSICISLYIIIYLGCLFATVYENKKDVDFINKKLNKFK
ncbi:Protein of uncharacterised function (DUF3021) [[Clostridium] sordellii]|uniref:DUF3021 domain-containing protein n=1 Tax=Paraclostridium sordellii TaxID=1505 RepID=UPI0005E0A8BA|nr:DUF3021 domain-containing protein [Paeniclostridium sordellii]CEN75090.1 Protein of uncharacterised function (DUF3021) [[Clostridium] sordellii] [Paeniclostridium sordellii]